MNEFTVLNTRDLPARNDIKTCFVMSRRTNEILCQTEINNGLFKISLESKKAEHTQNNLSTLSFPEDLNCHKCFSYAAQTSGSEKEQAL